MQLKAAKIYEANKINKVEGILARFSRGRHSVSLQLVPVTDGTYFKYIKDDRACLAGNKVKKKASILVWVLNSFYIQ